MTSNLITFNKTKSRIITLAIFTRDFYEYNVYYLRIEHIIMIIRVYYVLFRVESVLQNYKSL